MYRSIYVNGRPPELRQRHCRICQDKRFVTTGQLDLCARDKPSSPKNEVCDARVKLTKHYAKP